MSKNKKKKNVDNSLQHQAHLPNKIHLQACIDGAQVQRNRKKYTRKGKSRYDYRKDNSWTGSFCAHSMSLC